MGRTNNYFDMMLSRYNGDEQFISMLSPESIQRSAKGRIFREMVKGEIDYTRHGKFFLEPKFLENLIIAAKDELRNKNTILYSLVFYDYNFPGNPDIIYNRTLHENLVYIYNTIVSKLNALKYCGDIGVMVDIRYILRGCQKYM